MVYYANRNRMLCDVLQDMREADKTKNYGYLLGLIEEAQYRGSRMEASLEDQRDLITLTQERQKLLKKVKRLRREVKQLEKTLGIDEED